MPFIKLYSLCYFIAMSDQCNLLMISRLVTYSARLSTEKLQLLTRHWYSSVVWICVKVNAMSAWILVKFDYDLENSVSIFEISKLPIT